MHALRSSLFPVLIAMLLHGCGMALMHAADQGDMAAVDTLLAQGYETDGRLLLAGSRPLILAAAKGHMQVVRLLLDRGAHLNATDYTGWTALHAAIYGGYAEVVQLLLERGAELDQSDYWYLPSPIMLAESLARSSDDRKKVVTVLRSFQSQLAAKDFPR